MFIRHSLHTDVLEYYNIFLGVIGKILGNHKYLLNMFAGRRLSRTYSKFYLVDLLVTLSCKFCYAAVICPISITWECLKIIEVLDILRCKPGILNPPWSLTLVGLLRRCKHWWSLQDYWLFNHLNRCIYYKQSAFSIWRWSLYWTISLKNLPPSIEIISNNIFSENFRWQSRCSNFRNWHWRYNGRYVWYILCLCNWTTVINPLIGIERIPVNRDLASNFVESNGIIESLGSLPDMNLVNRKMSCKMQLNGWFWCLSPRRWSITRWCDFNDDLKKDQSSIQILWYSIWIQVDYRFTFFNHKRQSLSRGRL